MGYGSYVKYVTKTAVCSSLVLGLLLAILIIYNGGVTAEIDLELAISNADSIWFLVGTPALVTLVFLLLSPVSYLIFNLTLRKN